MINQKVTEKRLYQLVAKYDGVNLYTGKDIEDEVPQ